MFGWLNGLTVLLTVFLAAASLLLLLDRAPGPSRFRGLVSRTAIRLLGPRGIERLDWRAFALVIGGAYAAVAAYDFAVGLYACSGSGPSDLLGLYASGRAAITGGNPFSVANCGSTILVPYGLAAVLVDAIGSLGGPIGVSAVWGVVAVALVPLAWWTAGADRRYLVASVALSPLYLPIVVSQIDGASNAIVPLAVLLTIVLARSSAGWGAVLGGALATARFPSLFPVVATTGGPPRRYPAAAAALASFAAISGVAYLRWRSAFLNVVFLSQVHRQSFSLNAFGILLDHHLLPGGDALPVAQALLTLAVMAAAFWRGGSALRAGAIALTGVALLTQFLSQSILLTLLPIALVGPRERWWLWGIALTGTMNYDLALNVLARTAGVVWPTDLLDAVLTVLLVGLFVELWRGARTERSATRATTPAPATRRAPG